MKFTSSSVNVAAHAVKLEHYYFMEYTKSDIAYINQAGPSEAYYICAFYCVYNLSLLIVMYLIYASQYSYSYYVRTG